MGEMFDVIDKFFTDNEWYFMRLDNRPVLQMGFQGKNGKWTCYASVDEEQRIFFFYSVCPNVIPEESRPAVCEFITRANYGMKIGNFELDYNDGEVRYKTSVDVDNVQFVPTLISNMVNANVWTMDRYLPGILSVVYGNKLPQEAIAKVEGNSD